MYRKPTVFCCSKLLWTLRTLGWTRAIFQVFLFDFGVELCLGISQKFFFCSKIQKVGSTIFYLEGGNAVFLNKRLWMASEGALVFNISASRLWSTGMEENTLHQFGKNREKSQLWRQIKIVRFNFSAMPRLPIWKKLRRMPIMRKVYDLIVLLPPPPTNAVLDPFLSFVECVVMDVQIHFRMQILSRSVRWQGVILQFYRMFQK